MPIRMPASTGRRRAQARMPAVANAAASASKLVNACTMTSGDNATSAASHTRRPVSRATAQVVTSQARASQNAVMSK